MYHKKERKLKYRARLLELFQSGLSAPKAQKIMKKEFTSASRSAIHRWYRRFSEGNFNLKDKEFKWHRRSFEPEDVEKVLAEEPNLSSTDLAKRLKTTRATVLSRLHEMNYLFVDGKWIPSLEDIIKSTAKPEKVVKLEPKIEKIVIKKELDLNHKVFIVRSCYENRKDYQMVLTEFETTFNVQPTDSIITILENVLEVFETTGSVNEEFYYEVIEINTIPVEHLLPEVKMTEGDPIKTEMDETEFVDVDGEKKGKSSKPSSKPKPTVQKRKASRLHINLEHRPIPLPTQEHECDVCHKVFKSLLGMRLHKQIHEGNSFECDICHKTYTTKTYLRKHKRNHRPIEERKIFICDICGKGSTQKANHEKHLAVHFPNK